MKYIYYLLIPFLTVGHCTSIPKELTDQTFKKTYEGFIRDDVFQVHCSCSLYQQPDELLRRAELIKACRIQMVKILAEFKIIYDYNRNGIWRTDRPQQANTQPSTNITPSPQQAKTETNLRRYKIEWTEKQVDDLLILYKDYLPGTVIYEWIEADIHYFLYAIHKPGLIQEIKNIVPPFTLEYNYH